MTTIDRGAEFGPPASPLAIKERVNVPAMTALAAVGASPGQRGWIPMQVEIDVPVTIKL